MWIPHRDSKLTTLLRGIFSESDLQACLLATVESIEALGLFGPSKVVRNQSVQNADCRLSTKCRLTRKTVCVNIWYYDPIVT